MEKSWRPEFPPIPLPDKDLAKIGFVAVCDSRTRHALADVWKALAFADLTSRHRIERKPANAMLILIRKLAIKFSEEAELFSYLEELDSLIESSTSVRRRIVHGIWGQSEGVGTMVYDVRQGAAFPSQLLDSGVLLASECANVAHRVQLHVARMIADGRLKVHPPETGSAKMRVGEEWVSF